MQRFFALGRPQEPGVVVIDSDQLVMYEALKIPRNWERLIVPPLLGFVAKANRAFAQYPDCDWYAFGGDDAIGRTAFWDSQLAAQALKGKIAWGNDLMAGHCTHPFIPGDLARAFGWVCHPAFKHLYTDSIWEHIAVNVGIDCYCPEIVQEAHHYTNGKLPRDRTSLERMEQLDAVTFKTIDLEDLVVRARACVASR
jgi:hypothetical protein